MTDPFVLVDNPVEPPGIPEAAALANLAWAFHHSMRRYTPTPLHSTPALAAQLGIGSLRIKDESHRFGLSAFKGLGASFAVHRWLATHEAPAAAVFTTATDGNHGRAVAWTARQLGFRSVVFMPADSVSARVEAIRNEGAKVILVEAGYDAAVQLALEAERTHGWIVIQDTATTGYRDIPRSISAGYWTMARELEPLIHGANEAVVDVVLLPAGVGSWPAAMTQYYWHRYGGRRPRLVVVEPIESACVLESARAGKPVLAGGSLRTIMAGLNCGYPSIDAFDILRASVDAFIAIPDAWAEEAMRGLATAGSNGTAIVAGETGAAGLAGLMAVMRDPSYTPVRRHLGLGPASRVLAFSTEGATDPDGWQRVVGRPVPE